MSRGRLNIATCLLTGSIETTIRVSVLKNPWFGRWSAPINRMLSCSLPSHGGMLTWGRADPTAVGTGVGVSVGSALRLSPGWFVSVFVASADVSAEASGEALSSGQTASVSPPTKMHGLSSTSIARTS